MLIYIVHHGSFVSLFYEVLLDRMNLLSTSLQVPASERPSNGPAASICVGILAPRSTALHKATNS